MYSRHSLPAQILRLVENAPGTVLLHDASPNSTSSRLFLNPLYILEARTPGELSALFSALEEAVAQNRFAAGWFAYECGAAFEAKSISHPLPPGERLAWFGVYDRCFLFDSRIGCFVGEEPEELRQCPSEVCSENATTVETCLAICEEDYAEKIAAIHAWIAQGDVYQINFTHPLRVQWQGSATHLYAELIRRQPAPYAAYLHPEKGRHLLSFSPELFFRLEEGGGITARPMKGTIARGRFTAEDQALALALRNDPKNRAENLMIVDLLRNDLGHLCRFGSVRAEDLFAVERHPTLWQMTSTIHGELRQGISHEQFFRALFPCGSITGAPKIRAMQLIHELEDEPRGIYTGSIGFFSKNETVFNVAIRTLDLHEENGCLRGTMGVGGGIVSDSQAQNEFRECLLKAEFLIRSGTTDPGTTGQDFELVETMLWRGEISRLELHLDRLEDSADYFDFSFARESIRKAIQQYAAGLFGSEPHKLRLLLQRSGEITLHAQRINAETIGPESVPLLICLWPQRTDSANPLLFHKTTCRPLYAQALQQTLKAGFDDVLFENERGELTESAIANLFVQRDGRLWTPPIHCGLLAGVERRHLLATLPNAGERILTRDDLRDAEPLWLSNAVRGFRRAILVTEAGKL